MTRPFSRSRRTRVAAAAVLTVALGAGACSSSDSPERPARPSGAPAPQAPIANGGVTRPDPMAGSRPNILFITVDDMAPRDLEWMPKVRSLIGDQGVTHTNAITPTPICAPSRASWMSGQYATNHGVHTVQGPRGGFDAFDENDRLPSWLQSAGYQTGFLGKYLNGYGLEDQRVVPPGWTDWRGSVDMTTYDFSRVLLNVNGRLWDKVGYQTPIFAEQTNRMITRFSGSDKPWFINVNYVAPHHGGPGEIDDPDPTRLIAGRYKPHSPAVDPRYRDTRSDVEIPDQPDQWRQSAQTKGQELMDSTDRKVLTEIFQQRLESLRSVDDAVASHLELLKKSGELDDTLVVFMSDNGMSLGEHNRMGKLAPYYESLQVPLLVRGPGVPQGVVDNSLVTNADLPVTFATLAGATPTTSVDGIDVAPLWSGARMKTRSVPLAGWAVRSGKRREWFGVRVDDAWTYSRGRGQQLLFDLSRDPWETDNVALRPDLRDRTTQMRRLAKELQSCAGVTCQTVQWAPDAPTSTAD